MAGRGVLMVFGREIPVRVADAELALVLIKQVALADHGCGWSAHHSRLVDGWIHGWGRSPAIVEELVSSLGLAAVKRLIGLAEAAAVGVWTREEHQRFLGDVSESEALEPRDLAPGRTVLRGLRDSLMAA